jgi:prolyl-tRNA synthetase
MLITHGDDGGTTIPPKLAPIQVVVVPIYYGEEELSVVMPFVREVVNSLASGGVRVYLDDRADKTPGWKFYYWELKGVPLRVEVGKRDVEKRQAVVTRRDTLEKYAVGLGNLVDAVRELMRIVEENLRKNAWEELRRRVVKAEGVEAAKAAIREGKVVEVPWSGDNECGMEIQELVGADALGVAMDADASVGGYDLRDLACRDKRAEVWLRLSERY